MPPGGQPSRAPNRRNRETDFRRRRLIAMGVIVLLLALCALLIRACVGDGKGDSGNSAGGSNGAVSAAAPAEPPTALELSKENGEAQNAAIADVLSYTPYLKEGRRRQERVVALTFDDGPNAHTDEVLRILRRFDAPSTFFLNGYVMDEREETVRKIIREGHAIGNHGQDHAHMGQLAKAEQASQIDLVNDRLRRDGVALPHIFRPPYGSFDQTTIDLLGKRDMLMVLWSIDTTDYTQPGAEVIAARALEEVRPGSVILMHDGGGDRTQTIEALPSILKGLKERNLHPVTVPELLITNPPPRDQRLEEAVEVLPPGVASTG